MAKSALGELRAGEVVGIGSGTTVNVFLRELAASGLDIAGVVVASEASATLSRELGLEVIELAKVESLRIYVDGADQINPNLEMIKGGGAALTREKIIASAAQRFVAIVDASKWVSSFSFPIPVEYLSLAWPLLAKQVRSFGAEVRPRDGVVTDNGLSIGDITGLEVDDAKRWERQLTMIPGVLTAGIFASRRADIAYVADADSVRTALAES